MLFAISYLVLYDLALSFEVCVWTNALQNKDPSITNSKTMGSCKNAKR